MKKEIPKKNYIILILLVLLVISACFAFANLYNIYQTNKISVSPLENNRIHYDDLKNATVDIGADTFLVISYLNDKNVYNAEKRIKTFLDQNNLVDNVMYLNATEHMKDDGFINELNKVLNLNNEIKTLPAVVFYQDNNVKKVVDSSDTLLNSDAFKELIELYVKAS